MNPTSGTETSLVDFTFTRAARTEYLVSQVTDGVKQPPFLLTVNCGTICSFAYPRDPFKSAIVNATNPACLGGSGVDGAISKAGGPTLHTDRTDLHATKVRSGQLVRCFTGDAVLTGPNHYGELLVPYVIHAVGPKYARYAEKHKEEEADVKLANAYTASLARAQEVGIEAIAFSLISAGAYRGEKRTLHDIVQIALTTLCSMRYEGLKEIHVCGFNENEYLTLIEVAHKLKLVRVCNDPNYQEFMTPRG